MSQLAATKITVFILIASFCTASCAIFGRIPPENPPEMVYVEGGAFMLGDVIEGKNEDAMPVHEVTLESFYIGKYEVTFAQFDRFAEATGSEKPDDEGYGRGNRAVVHINWQQAQDYCEYYGMRLPSEAEWEYAARARGKNRLYAGTNNPDSLKAYSVNSSGEARIRFSYPVGTKKPNELGLYDMSGNAYEWIGEFYQFYEKPEGLNDNKKSMIRIIRGGSFGAGSQKLFWRVGVLSDAGFYDLGFRCAVSEENYWYD